jgi:NAD(P)-dependent dehydrogenase (short-subunit alcohol dehydrogenase family)
VQVVSDVSIEEDMARLARQTFERFGAVHLLFNNAGVVLARPLWEYTRSDWEWLLGVNLWSVIHSLRHFVPLMLSQEEESHIVNTASVAGFLSASGMAAYNVSKHGVVTLSETLRAELAVVTDRVNVSVLCPAWVPTAIGQAERKRPARFGETAAPTVDAAAYGERITHALASGRLSADDIARITFEAVAARHFYIIPHAKIGLAIRERMQEILAACTPNAAEDEQ